MAKIKNAGNSVVKPCSCKSEYQDKVYGNGKRLHTVTAKGFFRCTVCGKDKQV